jgi:hypothetical protein
VKADRVVLLGLALILLAACRGTAPVRPGPGESAETWFLEVAGEGGYWLGPDELRAMGVEADGRASPTVRLSWDERTLPHLPLQSDGGWGVLFFAPDRSPRTSVRTAIRLERGVEGLAMEMAESPDGGAPTQGGSCSEGAFTARWEEERRYLPQAEMETPWLWQPLRTPGSVTETVVLTDAVAGPVTVTLDLWSHTAAPANPDHRLLLGWDGERVEEWTWDGQGMRHLTTSFLLNAEGAGGEHRMVLDTPALPDVEVALAWLDGWKVSYRRPVVADGAVWRAEGSGLRVEEAGPGARALDVSDPFAARDLGTVAAGDCVATAPGHRYWVGVPEETPGPAAVRAARELDLEVLEEVAYLAIAPPASHAPLQPLIEHRQGEGLTAAVVEPQAVYDVLGTGQPEPEAVQTLVRRLPALRYLLVVGDGTAEPAGSDAEDEILRVVVPFTRTKALGEAPADGLLGTDEAGRPIVAVGRLPATTVDEVQAMVEKTVAWESAEGAPRSLLLSDDEAEFDRMAEDLAELLPPGASPERLRAEQEGSRSDLLTALDQGRVWLNYTGHGSLTLLCDEGLLSLEDGESWSAPALVTAWTCLAAHYVHPSQDSMAEAWLRADQGGAVAFLGPVGETTTSQQRPFADAFYRALEEQDRLGDAWLAALREGRSDDVRWGYVLLGDPALRLNLD